MEKDKLAYFDNNVKESINPWLVHSVFHDNIGFVTDEDVMRRESKLRDDLRNDSQFKVKSGALVEVAQVPWFLFLLNEVIYANATAE